MIIKSFTTPRDVQILKLAVPSIISNITVPLLGLVDVAIVGHIGDASYIGAVAVGTMLFNLFYWVFAFLRMGTSGMTSQALGRRDLPEVARLMARALLIGLGIGASLIALQTVVFRVGFWLMGPAEEVLPLCLRYCEICVWGAPAVMGLYGLTGWFIGMQNTKIPMWVSIAQNVVNITMSLLLVFVFGLDIEGVALGTLIAQWSGFLVSLWFWIRIYAPRLRHYSFRAGLWEKGVLAKFFRVNGDIFLRTLCIAGVNFCFTSAGARQGTLMLAVNTLLMTLFTIFAYFMDGNIDEMKKWLSKHMSGYENDPNFQKFKDSNPEASESDILSSYGSVAWLQFNCPNYLDIVNNSIKEMRDEMTKNRDVILKGSLGEATA